MRKLAAKTLMEILPPEIEQMVCDCIFCHYLLCHHLLLSLSFCVTQLMLYTGDKLSSTIF